MVAEYDASTQFVGFEEFFHQYMEAAVWSSTDDEGEPLDRHYSTSDLASETQATMRAECADFIGGLRPLLRDAIATDPCRAGHDFWLTRNGHGAGFWDGDWKNRTGRALTDASKPYGDCYLYVGDDGKIYCQ